MSKDIYRRLCAADNSLPIFSRDWWLDAVCGDSWQVLLEMRNGRVDAAMPIYSPCRRIIYMPHYTQTMGIWFAPRSRDMKYTSLLEHRQAICKRFIVQLKNCRVFIQYFSQDFTDWLPFYWAKYAQTTRYSYVLYGLRDSARLLAGMSHQTRRNIKKAESTPVTVRRGVAVEDFLHIQALTFRRQN